MKTFKTVFSVALRVVLSIGLLVYLFRQVDKKALLEIIKNANKTFLLLAFFVSLTAYIIGIHRWEMLLRGAGIHLSLKRIIMSFAGGVFFSLFLPSTIGGDLVRSVDLAVHTQKPHEVVATVLMDRLSGYVGLVLIALSAVLIGWHLVQDTAVLWSVAIITAVLVILLVILFNRFLYSKINQFLRSPGAGKIREALKTLHHEIHIFRHRKVIIFNNIILSIIIQAIPPMAFYITALSLGVKVNIVYFFVFLPIISAITLLPISIGGLGVRENMAVMFFAKAGMSHNSALALSLVNSLFILICGLIGGLIYVLTLHHRRLQHHPSPHIQPAHHH